MIGICLNQYCARPYSAERKGHFCSKKCATDVRLGRFRSATNAECVDCGEPSMGGGAWCYDCFIAEDRDTREKATTRRLSVWKASAA